MSQGDSTFNATLQIKVLLRELALCRRPESGYDDGDAGAIVEAIGIIRKRADHLEQTYVEPGTASDPGVGLPYIPWQGIIPPFNPFPGGGVRYASGSGTLMGQSDIQFSGD